MIIRNVELDHLSPSCKPDIQSFNFNYRVYNQSAESIKLVVFYPNTSSKFEWNVSALCKGQQQFDSFSLSGNLSAILHRSNVMNLKFICINRPVRDNSVLFIYPTTGGGRVEQTISSNRIINTSKYINVKHVYRIIEHESVSTP